MPNNSGSMFMLTAPQKINKTINNQRDRLVSQASRSPIYDWRIGQIGTSVDLERKIRKSVAAMLKTSAGFGRNQTNEEQAEAVIRFITTRYWYWILKGKLTPEQMNIAASGIMEWLCDCIKDKHDPLMPKDSKRKAIRRIVRNAVKGIGVRVAIS